MVVYKENKVQRPHAFAIVDEVDSILIDEARTPLIISGKGDKSTDLYAKADAFAKLLKFSVLQNLTQKRIWRNITRKTTLIMLLMKSRKQQPSHRAVLRKPKNFRY